jgi:hypothetical protein
MSLVGNFAFGPSDGAEARAGASPAPHTRRPSQPAENAAPIGLHRTSTQQSNQRRKTSESVRPEIGAHQVNESNPNEDIEKSKINGEKVFEDSTDEEDQRREAEVGVLARKLTKQSSFHSEAGDVNPFEAGEGSRLDPHSEHFVRMPTIAPQYHSSLNFLKFALLEPMSK